MITHTTRWLLAGLLSLSLWTAAASSEDGRWQGYIDDAVEAFVDGDYVEAGRWFDAAIKRAEAFGPQDPRLATCLVVFLLNDNALASLRHPKQSALSRTARKTLTLGGVRLDDGKHSHPQHHEAKFDGPGVRGGW